MVKGQAYKVGQYFNLWPWFWINHCSLGHQTVHTCQQIRQEPIYIQLERWKSFLNVFVFNYSRGRKKNYFGNMWKLSNKFEGNPIADRLVTVEHMFQFVEQPNDQKRQQKKIPKICPCCLRNFSPILSWLLPSQNDLAKEFIP